MSENIDLKAYKPICCPQCKGILFYVNRERLKKGVEYSLYVFNENEHDSYMECENCNARIGLYEGNGQYTLPFNKRMKLNKKAV